MYSPKTTYTIFCFWERGKKSFHELLKRKTRHVCSLLSSSICGNMSSFSCSFLQKPLDGSQRLNNKFSQHSQLWILYCLQMNNQHLTGLVGASCLQSESVDKQEFASKNLIVTTSSVSYRALYFGLLVLILWNNLENLRFSFRQIYIRKNK